MHSTLREKGVNGKLSLEVSQERLLREERWLSWAKKFGYLTLGRGLVECSCLELQTDEKG